VAPRLSLAEHRQPESPRITHGCHGFCAFHIKYPKRRTHRTNLWRRTPAAGKIQRMEKEKQNFVEEITDLSAQVRPVGLLANAFSQQFWSFFLYSPLTC